MGKKEQRAKEYCEGKSFAANKYQLSEEAFKAGWEAALDYFSSLPFDKMLEAFDKYFKEKEERK